MKDFFKNDNGQSSLMRMISFLLVICIMIPWGWISITKGVMIPFSDGSLYVLGIAFGGKSVQKLIEGFASDPKDVVLEVIKRIKKVKQGGATFQSTNINA